MAGLVIGTTDVPVGRLASRLDCNPQKEERSLSAPTYTGERMTTMNNEDPADPSAHEQRVLDAADDPLPQPRVPNHVLECIYANGVGEVAAQTGESS